MSTFITLAFDDDPRWSPHVETAFGRGPKDEPWARVTVFSGGGGATLAAWTSVARDAVLLLSGVFPDTDLASPAFAGAECLPVAAPVLWGSALASVASPRQRDPLPAEATPPPPTYLSAAASPTSPAPDVTALLTGLSLSADEAYAHLQTGAPAEASVEEVFAKVAAYARQYGSHPDFRSRDLRTITKVNNYIASTYGAPLPAATLEQVRARLARI